MEKATQKFTKSHNTTLILRTIYEEYEISRAELARKTGLARPTVSIIVADLIEKGYVIEVGRGPSAGGKRPTLLNLAHSDFNLLCLDLGGTDLRGALVDLRGNLLVEETLSRQNAKGPAAIALIEQMIERLLDQAEVPMLGIGIGSPGLVDPHNGIILHAVNLGWEQVALSDMITARFELPVFLANNSHMAALAEFAFGETTPSRNLILIKVGQGIGSGIVVRGKIFFGDGFGAGEIGHVVVKENGEVCSCGNSGCLETISSTRAMLQHAGELSGNSAETWQTFLADSQIRDSAAEILMRDAATYLGGAVANLIGAFNIHHIVITGRVVQLGDLYLQTIAQAARQRVPPSMAAETQITFSTLGGKSVILGCAALILQQELGVI